MGDEAIPRNPQGRRESVVKTIAQLDEKFARIEIVRSAEGEAVVEEHAAVGDVDGLEVDGEALSELLAERQIKRCVRLKVIAASHLWCFTVGEARGVGNV